MGDVRKTRRHQRLDIVYTQVMLFRFKSKVTGDLLMLDPHGRRMLKVMGKGDDAQGIIQVKDIPACIVAIEQAIDEEAQLVMAQKNRVNQPDERGMGPADQDQESNGKAQAVLFKHRALPMLDMLRKCQEAEVPIVWGV